MTDFTKQISEERELEQLLHSSFPPAKQLSAEFEDRVMDSVKAIERAKKRRRKITRLMAVYWGLATAISSGLLADSVIPENALAFSAIAAVAITVLLALFAAWFVTRQSRIPLYRLFARTLL